MGIVLSPHGGALGKMLLPFRLGVGGRLGSGRQWMSWIAMDDAVAALLYLLSDDAPAGAVNFTAPSPVRNLEFTARLGRVLHRPAVIPVPTPALELLYGRDMPREALLASARVLPRALLDSGFAFRYPEIEPAFRHVLGRE
jgi:uncharacterized protein (TIGR01777 family)